VVAPFSFVDMSVVAFSRCARHCRDLSLGRVSANFREQRWRLPRGIGLREEAIEVGCLGTRAAHDIDDNSDDRAAEGETESDPQRDGGARIETSAGRGGEVDEDRATMKAATARKSSTMANTR